MFQFGKKSKERLKGAHPDFVKVAERAIQLTKVDFGFSEVLRTLETQQIYVDTGKSQTLNSRHLPDEETGLCFAGDVYGYVDGKASYQDKDMRAIAKAFFKAAIELGIQIEWGGHWKSFIDKPHYQLSHKTHPKSS